MEEISNETQNWKDVWEKTKNDLLNDDVLKSYQNGKKHPNKKETLEILFDNTIDEMKKINEHYSNSPLLVSNNEALVQKLILPVVRAAIPDLLALEIIGVQPMKAPISKVNTLRVTYGHDEPVAKIITKEHKKVSTFELEALEEDEPEAFESTQMNRLSIQIMSEVVESRTRKLLTKGKPNYDILGKDDYDEYIKELAHEVQNELNHDLLIRLDALAGAPYSEFDMNKITGGEGRYIGDVMACLSILINRQCNLIAARTRRGAGNWCVVSPTSLKILKMGSMDVFSAYNAPNPGNSVIKLVGHLNNTVRVYLNPNAADDTPVLFGYTGNQYDSGAFYCPLVPLVGNLCIDPVTFDPVVSFMTRFGFMPLPPTRNSLANGSDYFGKVGIDTKSLSFV